MAVQVFNYVDGAWSASNTYQQNDVVTVDGTRYVAIQNVPSGTQISNTTYWFQWLVSDSGQLSEIVAEVGQLQTDMETANSNIGTLQTDVSAAEGNITTLQGQMSTANSNIGTLQTDVDNVESNVTTLQSDLADETTAREDGDISLQTSVNYIAGFTPAS